MDVREFKTVDEVHQIWNDETWIRYHTIQNQMGMVDLTDEQEEELFRMFLIISLLTARYMSLTWQAIWKTMGGKWTVVVSSELN